MRGNGFTLIELVLVIVVLAILAGVAIPVFVDMQGEAKASNETYVAGAVRQGIMNFFLDPAHGDRSRYPCYLDTLLPPVNCSEVSKCFQNVMNGDGGGGVTSQWKKLSGDFACLDSTYRSPASATNVWTYTPHTGEFRKTAN